MPKIKPSEVLENFIRVVEKLNPSEFTINTWLDFSVEQKCGTRGCILGWAAQDPWFKDLGLYFVPWAGDTTPHFGASVDFKSLNAGRAVLGLDMSVTEGNLSYFLFSCLAYDSEVQDGEEGKNEALSRLGDTLTAIKNTADESPWFPDYCYRDLKYLRELEKQNAED